jgi:hypothetical protein
MKIFVCFIQQDCLLAARMSYVVYANAQLCRINSLYNFSLYENICFAARACQDQGCQMIYLQTKHTNLDKLQDI